MSMRRIMAVFRFELQRGLTLPRLLWWAVLALFPLGIVLLAKTIGSGQEDRDAWATTFFYLVPSLICILGLLLWATGVLQSELEGRTWGYLAVRPHGKVSVLLGKYLTAVCWTATAGWAGLTLAIVVAAPERALHIWTVLAVLVLLSSLAYAALFVFIGVLAYKKAMVATVFYTLLFEFAVGFIPAMVNQFTVQFRLRTLLTQWVDWKHPETREVLGFLSGTAPAWQHVLILLALTAGLLAAAAYLIRARELVAVDDS